MSAKKLKHKLTWENLWNSPITGYIISSVANTITSGVIYQDKDVDIKDMMWQLFLFYYGRNRDMRNGDLVYIMPKKAFDDLIMSLYGYGKAVPTDQKLRAFLGIEIKPVKFLHRTILLVNKKWASVDARCEFHKNRLEVIMEPTFETRWVKAVLHRSKK